MAEDKYVGRLSFEEIEAGIRFCLKNAKALLNEARLLAQAGHVDRASFLAIASLEEVGKASVLQMMSRIPQTAQSYWVDKWSDFKSHGFKLAAGIKTALEDLADRTPESAVRWGSALEGKAKDIVEQREASLYVGFSPSRREWMSGSLFSSEELRAILVLAEAAVLRLEHVLRLGLLSPRALAIQQETLGGIFDGLPRPKQWEAEHLDVILPQVRERMRSYWRQMVTEGIVDKDADLRIMGVPLSEFIADSGGEAECP